MRNKTQFIGKYFLGVIIMKRRISVLITVIFAIALTGCATVNVPEPEPELPSGDPSVFLERSLRDIMEGQLTISEAHSKGAHSNSSGIWFFYNIVSNGFINRPGHDRWLVLSDGLGNELTVSVDNYLARRYTFARNTDFNSNQQYRVKFSLRLRPDRYGNLTWPVAQLISIEGLLPYAEVRRIADERRRAEAAERHAEIEAAFQAALSSRNPDTIMRFLRGGGVSGHPRSLQLSNEARIEVGRILARNNNIEVSILPDGLMRPVINPHGFDGTVIYYMIGLQVRQFIGRDIIVSIGSPNNIILLQNIPNIQNVRDRFGDVWMRYVGITPIRMVDGSTRQVATFDVLYHFQR